MYFCGGVYKLVFMAAVLYSFVVF